MIYEQIFNMLDVGLVILDRQLQVKQWNRWMELHSGISAETIVGKHLFEHYPDLDNPKFHRNFKSVLRLGNFAFFSQKLHHFLFPFKSVSSFGMEFDKMQQNCTMGPLRNGDNRVEYVYISVHDSTEIVAYEKSLQEALQKANKLTKNLEEEHAKLETSYKDLKIAQSQILQQEKMASIGQLAAGVAHEINNPMGFIHSNLSTLNKYIGRLFEYIDILTNLADSHNLSTQIENDNKRLKIKFISEDLKDLIKESLDGADRVKEIVQNLKSFSRIDRQGVDLINMNDCLESTLKIIWNELKYKTSIIKDYGQLPQTYCNPQELNQVFMNILVNAAHSIDNKGEITIQTREQNGMIIVAISDTGCGMPPEKLDRVFEPFFTTKPVGEGTGLGLSICYDIIKKHEGEISVESEVGSGSIFTVAIPVKETDVSED